MIFNYTQPAEDAVDEAETGLKSSLAVKIFGADLATLEEKAKQVKRSFRRFPASPTSPWCAKLGQPSLIITPDREKIARYGLNVSDINTLVETAIGGQAASQVIQGERQFDLVVRMQEPYREDADAIRNLLDHHAGRPAPAARASSPTSAWTTARRSSIASRTHATSACSSAWKAATWRAPWARRAAKWRRR